MSKYCVMPFVSVRIEDSNNNHSMRIRPCCLYMHPTPVNFTSMDDYLNSDMLKSLQHKLLTQEELPSECHLCKTVEESGQLSVRQLKNRYFNTQPTETQIQELDIFPSNVCNLRCIMCSPKYSSAIGAEQKRLGIIKEVYNFDETEFVCQTLDSLIGLRYVTIAGGEFFYLKNAKLILEKIIKSKAKNVKITTNGTVYDEEFVELLNRIDNLNMRFSLDGTGKIYEFVRYPAQWTQIQKNIQAFQKSLPRAKFETVIVMQPLTVYGVYDWLQFSKQNNLETHWINILTDDTLNWSMLIDQEKNHVLNFLKENFHKNEIDNQQKIFLLNYINNTIAKSTFDAQVRKNTVLKIAKICQSRNIQLEEYNEIFSRYPVLTKEINDQINENS